MSETPYTNFFKVAYSVGIVVWIGFSFPFGVIAQAEYAYKRSSLHLVLVDQAPYNSSRILKPAFFDSAFPDKYDPLPIQDTVLRLIDENSWRSRGAKKLIGDDTNQDIVRRVTLRNVESCYAKLQKTYDVFKTKTPLLSVNPASAQIGMKEALEGGERFEVLEVLEDPETGMQSLRRVGVIKVDKNKIWDNRFGADELLDSGANLGRTYFHGSGDFLPGMLIQQIR